MPGPGLIEPPFLAPELRRRAAGRALTEAPRPVSPIGPAVHATPLLPTSVVVPSSLPVPSFSIPPPPAVPLPGASGQ